jgi:hypothetical protein
MASAQRHSFPQIALMVLAIILALVGTITMVKMNQAHLHEAQHFIAPVQADLPPIGVRVALRSGTELIERVWPELNISLAHGDSIDAMMPPGPFEGDFEVTFNPGRVRYAQVGAIVQGGSVIVMYEGEVLLSDYSPADHSKVVLCRVPIWLPRQREQIRFDFKADASAPVRLQAIWQPDGMAEPLPLPMVGGSRTVASDKN